MENNYFDNAVRDAISDYEANFPASNWDEMESSLNADTNMRRKVYITKSIEMCLMVFAIWTVVHLMQGEATSLFNYSKNDVPNAEQPASPTIVPFIGSEEAQEDGMTSDEVIPFQVDETETEVMPSFEGVPIAGAVRLQNKVVNTTHSKQATTHFSTVKTNLPIAEQILSTQELLTNQSADFQKKTSLMAFNDWSYLQNIQLNGLRMERVKLSPLNILSPNTEKKEEARKPNRRFRIGPVASADWFNIKSPAIAGLSKKPRAINAAFGFTTDVKIANKWRFESGMSVSNRLHKERSYAPMLDNRAIEERKSNFRTTTLEIPTNVKYELSNVENNNHLYVLGGVSNHLVMLVQNQLEEQNTFANAIFNDPKQEPARANFDAIAYSTATTPEPTSSLSNNHYMSLNAGLGYERQLTKRLSVFGQVLYKHGLQPVGRDEEMISSISVSTGMRTSL